jgi:hypothetical protein
MVGCTTSPTQQAEIGYPKGALAYRALISQDWTKAERQLADTSRVEADDPARLLNLALLYRSTDRAGEARGLYGRVLDGEDMQLVLSNGSVASAHAIARAALEQPMTALRQ